ncbi:MAG: hypothetical protein HKN01_01610 [Acidimicrobiia bacterium]|nr:hypothetical protein [Acidimicrobiia bacterium]
MRRRDEVPAAVPPLFVIVAAIATPIAVIAQAVLSQVGSNDLTSGSWAEFGLLGLSITGLAIVVRYFATGKIVAVNTAQREEQAASREKRFEKLVNETHAVAEKTQQLADVVVDVVKQQQDLITRLVNERFDEVPPARARQ